VAYAKAKKKKWGDQSKEKKRGGTGMKKRKKIQPFFFFFFELGGDHVSDQRLMPLMPRLSPFFFFFFYKILNRGGISHIGSRSFPKKKKKKKKKAKPILVLSHPSFNSCFLQSPNTLPLGRGGYFGGRA
jgi:hypothetical protein